MAIPSVTFGALAELVKEFAPAKYATAVNMAVPVLADNVIKKADPDDSAVLVYGLPDGMSSTTFVEDLGDLPLGVANTPFEGKAEPKPLISVIRMGRSVSNAKMPDAKKATILDAHLEAGARNTARQLGRSLFGGTVQASATSSQWGSTGAADGTLAVKFDDVSLFRVGQAYDFVDVNNGATPNALSNVFVVRVQSIAPGSGAGFTNSANVAGTVTFINDVKDSSGNGQVIVDDAGNGVTVSTDDRFALRGTYSRSNFATGAKAAYAEWNVTPGVTNVDTALAYLKTGNALTSLDDICGDGALLDIYGINATTSNFKGQAIAAGSVPYSQELVLQSLAQMELYSDLGPNQVVMSPKLAAAHAASAGTHGAGFGIPASTGTLGGIGRKDIEKSMDKYGAAAKMTVRGLPITVDPNCPAGKIFMFNDTTLKLYQWREMGVVDEEGNGIRVLDDKYGFQIQIAGECELVAHERRDCGSISGLTSL
jgi:hypothetical protein